MTFSQPPFWASGSSRAGLPHAISGLVTPAIAIEASSVAAATILETRTAHGLVTGDTAVVAGHTGSTPAIDGTYVVTVLTPTTVALPIAVTVAGVDGTITRTVAIEPLTVAEGKVLAGLEWAVGDPRDALMTRWIAAARSKLERDTERALLAQTRDVYYDAIRGRTLTLPAQSRPLQAVVSVSSIDAAGAVQVLDPTNYDVDLVSGRLGLSLTGAWPTDLRPFQPYVLRIVSGWPSVAALQADEPMLLHLLGRLVAHYATFGRDLATIDPLTAVPLGYDDDVAPYRPVSLA